MMTPETLKAKSFQATGRGAYRADDVDGFFAEVKASYEQMFKENGELIKKISLLANKVEQYKEEEDSLRKALISAQTLADKIVRDAKESVEGTVEKAEADAEEMRKAAQKQADGIVAAAKAEADTVVLQAKKDAEEILGAVNRKVMKESLEFEMLQKKASDFRTELLSLYKEHLGLINSIPEYVEKEMPAAPANEQLQKAPAEAAEAAEEAAAEPAEPEAPAEETEEAPAEPAEEAVPVTFEDISSGAEETEKAEEAPANEQSTESDADADADADDEGFTLDLAALEEAAEEEAEDAPAASAAHTYATIEASDADAADGEDDDDAPVSFKSFFKKK